MKKIIFLNLVLLMASALFAVPAKRGTMTVKQPDGTTLNISKHGDEYFHYTTTDDGYLLTKNADGIYEYAEFDGQDIRSLGVAAKPIDKRNKADLKVLAKLSNNSISPDVQNILRSKSQAARSQQPAKVGTINLATKGLLILVNYTDVEFQSENTQTAMNEMLNGDNYNYLGATGSARQYFIDQSSGKYTPQFDVIGPITLPNKRAYYGANKNKNDIRPAYMVTHACSIAAEKFSVDFSKYDNDGDGYVDFVYILYAGVGEADSDVEDAVWPHNWSVKDAGLTPPTYNGKKINNYACSGELDGQTLERCGIGTFCHEFSHVLGLPDYYDTEYSTNYENNATPGKWSLMDHGSYNNDGKTPPNYSAHDKFYFGWATPTIMNTPSFVTIPADGTTYRAVTTGTLSAKTQSAVYYFENRQQKGWDAYLPGHGMLVTKVMYSQSIWNNNAPNNSTPMLYDIQEADGKSTGGDDGDTYPGTAKVTTYTPIDNFDLSDIAEDADGVITFNFMGGPTCDYRCTEFVREHCSLIDSTECIFHGETYTATLEADLGYELVFDDTHFMIQMGEDYLEAGTGYTFVDGVLTIPNVTANLTVCAMATKKVVSGQVVLRYDDLEGVVITSGISTNQYIDATQTLTITITAAECYETLSEDMIINIKVGDTKLTDVYTIENGVLTISIAPEQLTDDVSIIAYAEDKPTITFNGENCSSSNTAACVDSGTAFVTTIVPTNGYVVTADNILVTMGSDAADFTFENNVLTVNDVTVALYIVVKPTKIIPTQTIAEFIEAEGGECYLTGVVSGIENTTYGNFYLTDTSGKIYVYGLLTADLETQKFASLGVGEKDTLTVLAETYKVYNGTKEVVNAVYVSHKKYVPESSDEIENKTIAEFIEAEGGECYLTGVVSDIESTTYGNFYLTDTSGKIYVYGLLTADLETKKFASLGVGEKDTLTVLAKTYKVYNGTKEVVNAVYVSHKKYVSLPTEITTTQQGVQVCAISTAEGLHLVGLPEGAHIRIFDAVGRLLIDEKAAANEQTYALRSGLYLIQVSAQGQTTFLKAIH